MERIKSAAIKYRLVNDPESDKIVEAFDHTYCRSWFMHAEIYPNQRILEVEEEGFVTDSGRFVNRIDAYNIAEAAGQLISTDMNRVLHSYQVEYSK